MISVLPPPMSITVRRVVGAAAGDPEQRQRALLGLVEDMDGDPGRQLGLEAGAGAVGGMPQRVGADEGNRLPLPSRRASAA